MRESLCRNGSSNKAVGRHRVLLSSAGYAVHGLADSWSARKLLGSRRFDLAIIGSTDAATHQLLEHIERCSPPVPAMVLNAGAGARATAESGTLPSAVAKLVGVPDPTGGSPGPTAA